MPLSPPPAASGAAHRTQISPELLVMLHADSARPLHLQVYDGIRTAILGRRLASGMRLPSTRALAAALRVSRITVATAFDQLRAEGYIVGRRGSGTFVSGRAPDEALGVAARPAPRRGKPAAARAPAVVPTTDPDWPPPNGRGWAFTPGIPALDLFPAEQWGRLVARHWRRAAEPRIGRELLGYGDARGYLPLRRAIASYLTLSRGAHCHPDQVIVTNGAQQALDLVSRVLLAPGDSAWLEDPGYHGARRTLIASRARIVPVPLDEQGLDIAAGTSAEPRPRLVYVSPSHQYPTGVTMSAHRRLELLRWAADTGAWIVEDDYDSEFRYTTRPLACLQGMEVEAHGPDDARVLYVGTFSKALCPALRIGYLVAPPALVDRFVSAKAAADRATASVEQAALAEFIESGDFARHLRRARVLYAERQQALVTAVRTHLSEWLDAQPAPAGLHLVVSLRESLTGRGITDHDVALAARARGIIAPSLSSRTMTPRSPSVPRNEALMLGYAAFDEETLDAAARRLGDVIGDLLADRAPKS